MHIDPLHTSTPTQEPDPHVHEGMEAAEGGTAAAASSMLLVLMAIVAAFVLVAVVIAWSPWADGTGNEPGQGGDDNPPRQEQRIPADENERSPGSSPSQPGQSPSSPR